MMLGREVVLPVDIMFGHSHTERKQEFFWLSSKAEANSSTGSYSSKRDFTVQSGMTEERL